MAVDITLDELLAACRDAGFTGEADAPGKTTAELCEAWNCSPMKAKKILTQAKKGGMLRTGRRSAERLDGGYCRVPVYSFVFQPKKAKAKR